jgi:eukaryotic-like serine/threonine-protein kinase
MAMAEEPMADLLGRRLGEFILREQIGEGGCAVVYRSEQPALQRDVVVKVLHARGRRNDASLERFLREAQLASVLDHPYAAHVHAFGAEDDGLLWLAMELVQGITLSDWLESHGPMPLEQFVPFFECVAEVVHTAHERGIVHRDLKPSNVMVIERGERLFPKLLDFGIAKMNNDAGSPAVDAPADDAVATLPIRPRPSAADRTRTDQAAKDHRLTRSSSKLGSAAYMSPEQWTDARAVGPASDIYSLGVLAYEALTGRRPFVAATASDYYWQHLGAKIPALGGELSSQLDQVIQRALAKDPEARHRSVLELASELRAALRTQPREQLRSLAQMWADRARSPALLLKSDELSRAPTGVIGELEHAFVSASRRHAARRMQVRRLLAISGAALVVGAVWYRGELKAELAEATVTQAELEQGRSALLHNEPEALRHLAEAYRRAPSPPTAFMLARAMQPRLAEQARLASSSGRMWSAAFSPDGKQVVTTDDQDAQIWDAQRHTRLFTLPHGDVVYRATYSVDGTQLITGAGDGVVRIWEAATGKLVHKLQREGTRPRYDIVAMSPDGKLVAAIDKQGAVAHVWDAAGGAPLAELRNEASGISSLAFSADGHWLATSGGNDVRVFDTVSWTHALTLAGPGIIALSWDPHGPRLLTGSIEGDVSIWAIPGGERVHHLRDVGEPVDAVAFSPDGRLVVTASRDGAVQIWDATSGKLRNQGNYIRGKVLSVEFDPTSSLVVAAGASGAVVVTDTAQGLLVSMLDGPRNAVMVARFDPSSQRVVGASWDGTARIWEAAAPYLRWSSPPVSNNCGLVTSLEPDRRFVAVGCADHPTRIWDTTRGELLAELPSVTQVEGDFASAFPAVSTDGDRAAIARGHTVEVYNLPGGRQLRTVAHKAAVNTVAFSSTGRDIVSGAVDGSLLVTRESGALLVLPTAAAGIDAAGFVPDGRVVAADARQRLRVYDAGGAILAEIELAARARTLRMSSDGRRLITVPAFTGKVARPQLWDLDRYRLVAELEEQGQGQVYSARFAAGGRIVTACGDGAARLWDSETGKLRQTYRGGSRFLTDVTLSADGNMLVGGGGGGVLRFWDAASGRPLWAMPAHKSHLVGVRVEGDSIVTRGFSGDVARWALPHAERVIEACGRHELCAIVPK